MTKKKSGAAMPLIRMIDSEADALTELTLQNQRDSISFHELLLDEIDRAAICDRADIPPDVVTMGSSVTFLDEKSGAQRTVRLVYPADADIAAGRMSILTPVGAGLIGLSVGQSINWPDRGGIEHRLTIVAVEQPVRAA
ncbi:nucleoside diphosphate kinase regulator [Sphingopyxis sp. SE2]|jgi:regulator of nucleoside diphosphate kinase|uniref:nucleoside diphosphate kinase regulator n=1 Tax=unclassified Sphingopyxis TaxID=2614943 RepID=UPI00050FCB55|nr:MULTISPECIES: nucleoside diphosphate kinase regulator [unclassified Sphingopyxis]KGB51423.1 GreA/GreB family elongation factor [Sphingopyxis sp. LC363]MDT7528216.1 nucleoside diphosphate kinase regulator [Sphingopyxis sp. SE2]